MSTLPDEVIVVWQGDDTETRDAAEKCAKETRAPIKTIHSPQPGIVPAENAALAAAVGEIIFLIDDDAIAPVDWYEKHMRHYSDPKVGAVGGPARNFSPNGQPFPVHSAEPLGREYWAGTLRGNMYDHPSEWSNRQPLEVDHLVGYNMSLRRVALQQFEMGLRRYWQLFEWDACKQVRNRGFSVLFDFSNVVEHHPTNTAYTGGREGDLEIKIYNAAFNHGFIVGKHFGAIRAMCAATKQLAIGSVSMPGLLGATIGAYRFGKPFREASVLFQTSRCWIQGLLSGYAVRSTAGTPK